MSVRRVVELTTCCTIRSSIILLVVSNVIIVGAGVTYFVMVDVGLWGKTV